MCTRENNHSDRCITVLIHVFRISHLDKQYKDLDDLLALLCNADSTIANKANRSSGVSPSDAGNPGEEQRDDTGQMDGPGERPHAGPTLEQLPPQQSQQQPQQ